MDEPLPEMEGFLHLLEDGVTLVGMSHQGNGLFAFFLLFFLFFCYLLILKLIFLTVVPDECWTTSHHNSSLRLDEIQLYCQ